MHLRFIHAGAGMAGLFILLLSSILLYGCMIVYPFIPVEEHLGCSQFLRIINTAIIKVHVRVYSSFLLEMELQSLIVSMFKFIRNCQPVFQSVCTILHSQWHCMRVPVPPHPHQHCLLKRQQLDCLCTFLENQLTVSLQVYFWILDSIPPT